MKHNLFISSLVWLGFGSICSVQAAVSYSSGTYSQNFNGLNGVTSWANNSTLVGWYARTTATASITAIGSNTGSTTTAGLYSFGVAGTNAVTERSLGFVTSNAFTGAAGSGVNLIGINLTNSSASTLSTITIAYEGEQWRRESNTASQSLIVEYSLDATSLTTGTWTSTSSALTFTSPQVGSTALTLDGNATANSNRTRSQTISSVNWLASSNLWIRFVDLNDANNDHVLTIDNFSFSAVPEPEAALLGGLGLLGLLRRRRY